MSDINPFDLIPPGSLLYFNYGLAFVFLGVVILSKNLKESRLKIATPLKYLAMFGFTHGTLEWFELFLLFQGRIMTQPQFLLVKSLGLLFGVSFFFLDTVCRQPAAKALQAGTSPFAVLSVFSNLFDKMPAIRQIW